MTPAYENPERGIALYCGDCLEIMPGLAAGSVDAVVTDPPYELGFMGRKWDRSGIAYNVDMWREVLRVAKPGAHMVAFGGTRTYHRMACAIEDAGWEIRDCLMWIFGSGFPKSKAVDKAIDAALGAEREVVGTREKRGLGGSHTFAQDEWTQSQHGIIDLAITVPATPEARQWAGFGTALKPAYEAIVLARKPLDGTVAANVLKHGCGGLNIDAGRIGYDGDPYKDGFRKGDYSLSNKNESRISWSLNEDGAPYRKDPHPQGRWPANVILSPESAAALDRQSGESKHTEHIVHVQSRGTGRSKGHEKPHETFAHGDSGGASRFFYCAKASRAEREHGLSHLPAQTREDVTGREPDSAGINNPRAGTRQQGAIRNVHPTVKPLALMSYLCKLITPPGGVILDPFAGSGSTGCAAASLGFQFVGIEREQEYVDIAGARIEAAIKGGVQMEIGT